MIPWAEYIRNNFSLKIFSLALAMLIWYSVKSPTPNQISYPWASLVGTDDRTLTNLPIDLLILPDQAQRFTVSPSTADILIEGPRETINKLTASDIKIYAHIVEVNSPMGSFPLKPILPNGVTFLSITPSSVTVESPSKQFMLFPQEPID
jgi:YbbR domain-containing protein